MAELFGNRGLRRLAVAGAGMLVLAPQAACSEPAESDAEPGGGREVVVMTDDSWSMPAELREAFERQTGIELDVRRAGSSPRALADELVRSAGKPEADVAIGIDATTADRVLSEGGLEPYTSPDANKGQQRFTIDKQQRLSAIDLADVCVNVDVGWFEQRNLRQPETFDDLVSGDYADLLVAPSPTTSGEGQSFLFSTVAEFGEKGWPDYWSKLEANGVQIAPSARVAFEESFSAGPGGGTRPMVVAPASAPARDAADGETTEVLPDTCYRQVRYAGVLAGAEHTEQAQKLVDFLLSQQYQTAVAEEFGTYPTREGVDLPDGWDESAPLRKDPASLTPEQLADGKKRWVEQWRTLMER